MDEIAPKMDTLLSSLSFPQGTVSSGNSGDDGGACTSHDDGRANNGSGNCDAISSGGADDVAGRANGDDDDSGRFERMTESPASSCSSWAQLKQYPHRSTDRRSGAAQADF